jgi:sugar/nucleoside kinase (ribokinase family)
MKVVVVGDTNVDLAIRLPDRSRPSADLSQSVPQIAAGGSAGNTALALARLGVPTAFVGAVGDDGYGRWLKAHLEREGLDTSALRVLPAPLTPMVIALIYPDGERFLVVYPPERGADTALRAEEVDPKLIGSAAWLHTTGMCLRASPIRETVLWTMETARASGVPVSLDLNLRIELWGYQDETRRTVERAVELAEVVLGSATEEILPVAGRDSIEGAARALSGGRRVVVARLGAAGVLAASGDDLFRVPAFTTKLVNPVGAGDAFNAGFIAARLEGADLPRALRWGNAVAALKIAGLDAATLPRRGDVLRLVGEEN